MNLNKSKDNPARMMRWANKSLTVCSKHELIDCIFYLGRQEAIAASRIQQLEGAIRQLTAPPPPTANVEVIMKKDKHVKKIAKIKK